MELGFEHKSFLTTCPSADLIEACSQILGADGFGERLPTDWAFWHVFTSQDEASTGFLQSL